jgi:hypothetical protein
VPPLPLKYPKSLISIGIATSLSAGGASACKQAAGLATIDFDDATRESAIASFFI